MRQFIFVLTLLLTTLPLAAQEQNSTTTDLPERVALPGLRLVWQDYNRCSAAAFTILLSYWDASADYSAVAGSLNPAEADKSVRLDELMAYAESGGLVGYARSGGTEADLRRLLAAGFPVLIEISYYDGPNARWDWMAHNIVLVGYDDIQGVWLSYDPMLGAGTGEGRPIAYADFDPRWRVLGRPYLVLSSAEQQSELKALMGDLADEDTAAEYLLSQAEAEIDPAQANAISLFNRGAALTLIGRYEEAAADFDQARAMGLPWRMLWYRYEPFEAYLQTGQSETLETLARGVLADSADKPGGPGGIPEMHYYLARLYLEMGDDERAQIELDAALSMQPDDPMFISLQATVSAP